MRKNNDEFVKLYLLGERSLWQEEIERGSVFPRTGKGCVRENKRVIERFDLIC